MGSPCGGMLTFLIPPYCNDVHLASLRVKHKVVLWLPLAFA